MRFSAFALLCVCCLFLAACPGGGLGTSSELYDSAFNGHGVPYPSTPASSPPSNWPPEFSLPAGAKVSAEGRGDAEGAAYSAVTASCPGPVSAVLEHFASIAAAQPEYDLYLGPDQLGGRVYTSHHTWLIEGRKRGGKVELQLAALEEPYEGPPGNAVRNVTCIAVSELPPGFPAATLALYRDAKIDSASWNSSGQAELELLSRDSRAQLRTFYEKHFAGLGYVLANSQQFEGGYGEYFDMEGPDAYLSIELYDEQGGGTRASVSFATRHFVANSSIWD